MPLNHCWKHLSGVVFIKAEVFGPLHAFDFLFMFAELTSDLMQESLISGGYLIFLVITDTSCNIRVEVKKYQATL